VDNGASAIVGTFHVHFAAVGHFAHEYFAEVSTTIRKILVVPSGLFRRFPVYRIATTEQSLK
jgi:hypothetical protein